jgi:DnaJ-class molecular chaperone
LLSGSYQEYQRIFDSSDASLIWECVLHPSSSVSETIFVDHYEILQVSQTADTETIERVFRLLAKRYHPGNADTGDPRQFDEARKS